MDIKVLASLVVNGYAQKWYLKNKKDVLEKTKKYSLDNKGKVSLRSAVYHQNNKERISLEHKNNYEKNKEKILSRNKERYEEHRDNILERNKLSSQKYYSTERGKQIARNKIFRRKTKKLNQFGIVPKDYWQILIDLHGEQCMNVFCVKEINSKNMLTLDHVIPIFKGGMHDISNLQILCRSCNSRKRILCIDFRLITFYEEKENYEYVTSGP